ncbi:MAG: VOC family protein [Proteobacteria bacterium]|nr:VOC family protein [Pseudomonadota bacterium]
MNRIEGLHHLAIGTADIKGQIAYFTDVLGMELVALYWMHGVKNTFHGFLRLNDESSLAFVQSPAFDDVAARIGETHAGNPAGVCAPGTMQHLALKVKDDAQLLAMQDRIRSRGVPVLGPIDHGFCKSIYFAGLESLTLELSYSKAPIDGDAWIDPEVMARAGITRDELAGFRNPAPHGANGNPRAQPDIGGPGPHMQGYSPTTYRELMALPDETVTATKSVTEPPVRAG